MEDSKKALKLEDSPPVTRAEYRVVSRCLKLAKMCNNAHTGLPTLLDALCAARSGSRLAEGPTPAKGK
jgi:hypothetical protein